MIAPPPTSAARALAPLLLLAAPALAQGPPASPVRVDPVRLEEVGDRRAVSGELRAVHRSRVATREAGLVERIAVREGDRVEAGDPLAALDARRLELDIAVVEAERASAEAVLDESRARLEQSVRDLAVLEELDRKSAANPKELSDARTRVRIGEATVAGSERRIEVLVAREALLEQRRADTRIVAPFGGVVVARLRELGEWVGEGEEIVELVDDRRLEAWIEVPQGFHPALLAARGPLRLRVDANGAELESEDWSLLPLVDSAARAFPLVVRIQGEGLAPGMSVTAWVPTGARAPHLTVDPDAILRNDVGPYLFVAASEGDGPAQARPVQVEVLFATRGRLAVRSPALRAGELAVVEGNERLFPTAPVRVVAGDDAAPSEAGAGGSSR